MASGPTQNYDDASLGVWKGRPLLAGAVRVLIAAIPIALSVGTGLAAVHWLPPSRLGVNTWIWLLIEISVATTVLVLATRLSRRFLPLTTLLRLTLYFPDRAPSRLAVAMSHYSPDALQARLAVFGRRGPRPEGEHAARILSLVAAISDHDQLTRGHSERVQAYSALIGKELGLSSQDAAKLSWAALLHDVGKLRVPASVLSKPGEPTPREWSIIADHPEAGMEIAQPLSEWLGPWLDVIGQHHERWDGAGYPAGLAGVAISRGARIVAVADAYDVITSARSYKRALPASAARAELARCAGEQFDPQVVRAFLSIGLGRLRRVAGPLSILSILPGLPQVTADLPSMVQRLTTVGALKSTGAIGLVLSVSTATAGGALADVPHPPGPPASVATDTSGITTPQSGKADDEDAPVVAPTSTDAMDVPQSTPLPSTSDSPPAPSTAPTVVPLAVAPSPGTSAAKNTQGVLKKAQNAKNAKNAKNADAAKNP
ncbi:HD domain-containing protein [Cellulomonas humilata]|uniref:HD domain-containing protein n=1 Tax=Cellulomonas humilata TaxID=144055 RepID=A0A7Y6A4P9_9CELL|nr:HD-GYP domain-containing protein [Cellulomonas humilata]NUU19692.1 HD domain-containing protein [Cellulomonas humilata]